MAGIKIDKRVPLPEMRERTIYPFAQMKPGDSFLMKLPPRTKASIVQKRILKAANQFKKRSRSRATFTTRQVAGGVRCWRMK